MTTIHLTQAEENELFSMLGEYLAATKNAVTHYAECAQGGPDHKAAIDRYEIVISLVSKIEDAVAFNRR